MATVHLGYNSELYQGPAGATATVLVTRVRDLVANYSHQEDDNTTRASGGFSNTGLTLTDASIEWEMLNDDTDESFTAFRDAFVNKTNIAVKVVDANGGFGLDADFVVTTFTSPQNLAATNKVTQITLRLCCA